MLRSSPLIDFAFQYGQHAHTSIDHRRKYSNTPYFVHPHAVAQIVQDAGGTDMQIVWALLHDTDEDTEFKLAQTHAAFTHEFGEERHPQYGMDTVADEVTMGVRFLSDISTPADGRREIRKQIDREHNWKAPPRVKSVKLADLLDNGKDIWANDPDFAVTYFREKGLALAGLLDADLPQLVIRAQDMILQYMLDPNRMRSTKRPS